MREMTEETYNAIKNRTMTGATKFSKKVEIEGIESYWSDIISEKSNYVAPQAYRSFDYCDTSDGKIFAVVNVGTSIYYKILTKGELEGVSGSLNTGLTIIPGVTSRHSFGEEFKRYSLLYTKSKKILLLISVSMVDTTSKLRQMLFVSEDGTGTDIDWLNPRFLEDHDYGTVLSEGYDNEAGGGGFQTADGTIYMLGTNHWASQGFLFCNFKLFKSTDDGETWTTNPIGGETLYRDVGGFGFVVIRNGDLMVFVTDDYTWGTWPPCLIMSGDGGNTWVSKYPPENFKPSFGISGGYVYAYCARGKLYRMKESDVTMADLDNPTNWTLYKDNLHVPLGSSVGFTQWGIVEFLDGTLSLWRINHSEHYNSGHAEGAWVSSFYREYIDTKFDITSISISKSKGGANTASLKINNKDGIVNPRNPNSILYNVLNLNKYAIIHQGYGVDLVPSFTGIIDGIHMSTFPQIAEIKLRDSLKKALDQTVTKDGSQVVFYPHQPIENIVSDLCGLCGLPIGLVEPTGISIEKEFNWQTYADAIQFLSDIASFEFLVDESGLFYFRRDYQPNDMTIAWSFEEGVDIQDLSYDIDDTDIYKSVRVYGKSGDNILVYNAPFLDAEEFNILPQKIMKIDATEASTTTELRKIAERAVATMRSRTRVIRFTAIAIPHLQVGDFIQLFESSTNTHEIYRLSAINLTMTKDSFTMSCTGYYYGDSIVPGELPEDVATQTPDPALNLIPNMTSNTKPSGVASSSSTYLLYGVRYSPWRAFNNDDTDYFWDLSTKTGWIAYEFPEKTIVDKYVIKARQDLIWNKALPKDWKFEAFDGATWITLDTRTGETDWGIYEERSFIFDNTTPYAKYRLSVSANNGYVRTQIEQLSMYYGGGL